MFTKQAMYSMVFNYPSVIQLHGQVCLVIDDADVAVLSKVNIGQWDKPHHHTTVLTNSNTKHMEKKFRL